MSQVIYSKTDFSSIEVLISNLVRVTSLSIWRCLNEERRKQLFKGRSKLAAKWEALQQTWKSINQFIESSLSETVFFALENSVAPIEDTFLNDLMADFIQTITKFKEDDSNLFLHSNKDHQFFFSIS